MNDPVGERLRSYYQSIQSDAPARLESRIVRAWDVAPEPSRVPWRAALGLATAGAVLVIVALVAHNLLPSPAPSPSGAVGPSASATAVESPTASSGSPTIEPTPTPSATPTPTAAPPQFGATGSMTVGRDGPTATLLDTGRVLVTGGKVARGAVQVLSATAELYDPATGKFKATASMADARWGHTATLLLNGRVLIVGGADLADGFGNLKTAELYDPATGKFTRTGSMSVGRAHQSATLLADGRVLVAGGANTIGLASAEIYDPATGKFTKTGSMTTARQNQAATRLGDGRVLIAGGTANGSVGPFGVLATAEIYDPGTGKFGKTGSMTAHRDGPAATALQDGRVLVVGGLDQNSKSLNSAEMFDPATGKFSPAGAGIPDAALSRTVTLLPNGAALTLGRTTKGLAASLYDPAHNGFIDAGTSALGAGCQRATLLPDGNVLLLGGISGSKPIAGAAIYRP